MEQGQFETRLRCAVVAGWWTTFIAWACFTASWFAWLLIKATSPDFIEWAWGGVKLAEMQHVVLAFFGLMKLGLFAWVIVMIFLTIWSRKLRKAGQEG